jgi:hypothetical protein
MDIVILLLCAFFIINRLMKILGQYDPETERQRKDKSFFNFVPPEMMKEVIKPKVFSEAELTLPENLLKILTEIKAQDPDFLLDSFLSGAKKAFLLLHKALLAENKDELDFLLDNDVKRPKGEKIVKLDKVEIEDLVLYGDRAVITLFFLAQLENSATYQSKITFARYLTQNNNWKISKYQKLDVKKLASPDIPSEN